MARKLFWGSGSPWCWRLQITLEEKGLNYESILISFSKKEHKGAEITEVNPRGQVPTFIDGDIVVNESGAACQYLEAAYPDSIHLLPDEIPLKAKTLQFMYESTNLYTVSSEAIRYYQSSTKSGNLTSEEWETKKSTLRQELSHWEKYLEGKDYLVAEKFTFADAFLFPLLAVGFRFGIDFKKSGFPNIARYYSLHVSRPSIEKSWPPHWKEGPGNPILADL